MAPQQILKTGKRIHKLERQMLVACDALKMLFVLPFWNSFWKCETCAILRGTDTQSILHGVMDVLPNEIPATVRPYPKGVRDGRDPGGKHL